MCVLLVASLSFAQRWGGSLEYRTAKDFDQVTAEMKTLLSLNFSAGLKVTVSDEKEFKAPIYSLAVPFQWDNGPFKLGLAPFYYFNNKSDNPLFQNSTAFGINGHMFIALQEDTVNDLYTHAYLGASFVRQKGTLFTENNGFSNQYYSQAAYTLGLHKNFFRAFSFDIAANAFQYPDGISGVTGLRSIFNQQDLSSIQSFDITHELPEYTVGARITRLWPERMASLYLAYHFEEFYTTDSEHSFILGNTFALTENVTADIAYNHLRTVHNQDKRDIFYIQTHFFL